MREERPNVYVKERERADSVGEEERHKEVFGCVISF